MKKIVLGQNKKKKIRSTTVYHDSDVSVKAAVTVTKTGQRKVDAIDSLDELYSFDTIDKMFEKVFAVKNKQQVQSMIRNIVDSLKKYAEDLEEIGLSKNSSYVKKNIIPALNKVLTTMDSVKPKDFFASIKKIRENFSKTNPELSDDILDESSLTTVQDVFKNIKYVNVDLDDNTPAVIKKVPLSVFLYKGLSEKSMAQLKSLGCQFIPYSGAMLYSDAKFLIINKSKFHKNSDYGSTATIILQAISKNAKFGSLLAVKDINLNVPSFYAVLCVTQNQVRAFSEVAESARDIKVYIK